MKSAGIAVIVFFTASAQAATLITNTTAPTNVLVSQSNDATWTAANSTSTTGIGYLTARGQSFLMGDTGDANTQFAISSITVQKTATYTYDSSSSLTLWVFKWPSNNGNLESGWNNGTSDDGIVDGDPFDGTTISLSDILVNGEVSSIAGQTLNDKDYLHFTFGAPLLLNENTAYGFLVGFQGLATTGTTNRIQLSQGSTSLGDLYTNGAMITSSGGNAVDNGKDLTFWISGSVNVIPEPAVAMLSFLGTLLLLRRRRQAA